MTPRHSRELGRFGLIELVLTNEYPRKILFPGQYFVTFRPDPEALPSAVNVGAQPVYRRLSLEERAVRNLSIAPKWQACLIPFGLNLIN